MQFTSIFNRVQPHKSFVYSKASFVSDAPRLTIEVTIRPRTGSRPICSGCGHRRPGYDRLKARRFEFVPTWGILVFFVYALRRVNCPTCGVVAERVPWSDGKSQLTTTYQWFLAQWAKRLSWKEVAEVFHTTWGHVRNAVRHAVQWGLVHRTLSLS